MLELAQSMVPSWPAQPVASEIDFVPIIIALVPLVIMIGVMRWASKKKTRKKTAVEASYNLVALDLLVLVLLPICAQPFNCALWAIIPILMIAILVGFAYVHKKKEYRHKRRVARALQQGHVELTELLEARLEHQIKKNRKKAKKVKKEKKPKKEKVDASVVIREPEPVEEKLEEPKIEAAPLFEEVEETKVEVPPVIEEEEELPVTEVKLEGVDHAEIESLIEKVLNKKKLDDVSLDPGSDTEL